MSVEFIGSLFTHDNSEIHPHRTPIVERDYLRRIARAHEDGGFDAALIGYGSERADGVVTAGHAAAQTDRLRFLVAYRPGFVAPTYAARTFASFDLLTEGRLAVNVVSGGSEPEMNRDGDYTTKEERYARTDEHLDIFRAIWSGQAPLSHQGRFYRFDDLRAQVQPHQPGGIPIYFGGSSPAAIRVGAKHADNFMLFGEPLAETAQRIAEIRAAATAAGRSTPPAISASFRPILGATEELAWERAHWVVDRINHSGFTKRNGDRRGGTLTVGGQRLVDAAARGERHDRALFTATATAAGAFGNTTALVGTPETVAAAILDYVDIGVTSFLIRGYEPLKDAIDYGRHLIPLVRSELAHRQRTGQSAANPPDAPLPVAAGALGR
ncbi:alkanesulfonate monooxygenase [Micromonospora pallida]|uniref:Alkanesulfonate monooxygenase n=1 Tax=Micromonospora pallida TaxID=145854 RepID=A0A1C6SBV6_9ACTN|nr:LLM class flavin-dependent oxidoreductase [Micromonospora pallida]SCL26978.1 alkanesulfonate monooxygenase [Micromonospora pallida]